MILLFLQLVQLSLLGDVVFVQAFSLLSNRFTHLRPWSFQSRERSSPLSSGISIGHNSHEEKIENKINRRVVIVGKIIIDNYGDPTKRTNDTPETEGNGKLTVGGGGPQAVWGAAAALAVREHYFNSSKDGNSASIHCHHTPPKQSITFLAPIGLKNWTPTYCTTLENLLPIVDPPVLISSRNHITPMINIWHDDQEVVHWYPVDGSFEEIGADGLWRNRPSSEDIIAAVQSHTQNGDASDDKIVLHCILEAGKNATGGGDDALFLDDSVLLNKVVILGIEPVVFPEEASKLVSSEDGSSVRSMIEKLEQSLEKQHDLMERILVFVPDRACFDAVLAANESREDYATYMRGFVSKEIVVRNGANGSYIFDKQWIPTATLKTANNKPVNPTGAVNAYSAAFVACRGTGSTSEDSAVIATAVGAVMCEYDHLPDWSWDVLGRIAEAARDVKMKLIKADQKTYGV